VAFGPPPLFRESMGKIVKLAMLEYDGTEYTDPLEYQPIADDVAFSASGFTAVWVKEAIVEAKATASGKLRDSRQFTMNGTVGNGNWITPSELLPDYKYVFTEAVKFYGIEWSNANGTGRDFDLEFYKNGITVTEKFYTYPVRNSTYDYGSIIGLNYTFGVGDWMRVKYIDQGDNVADFGGRFLFEVL